MSGTRWAVPFVLLLASPALAAEPDFARIFDLAEFREIDPAFQIVQINRSLTQARGTIRGLHFQWNRSTGMPNLSLRFGSISA